MGAVRTIPGDYFLAPNDDSSAPPLAMGFDFWGWPNAIVNTNGSITFFVAQGTYTPWNLYQWINPNLPWYAAGVYALWMDIDTRNGLGEIRYGTAVIEGRKAFFATWLNCGYYPVLGNRRLTFQIILYENQTWEFNYDLVQASYGSASWLGGTLDAQYTYDNVPYTIPTGYYAAPGPLMGWVRYTYQDFLNETPAENLTYGITEDYFMWPGSLHTELINQIDDWFTQPLLSPLIDGNSNALTAHSYNSDVLGRYSFNISDQVYPMRLGSRGDGLGPLDRHPRINTGPAYQWDSSTTGPRIFGSGTGSYT